MTHHTSSTMHKTRRFNSLIAFFLTGVFLLTNLGIGYNTPPVGMNLFIASSRFNRPVLQLYGYTLPFLALLLISLIIITYWPGLSLFLPNLLKWICIFVFCPYIFLSLQGEMDMPIYEYKCDNCNNCFEQLIFQSDDEKCFKCPSCGGGDINRLISSFSCASSKSNEMTGAPVSGCSPSKGFSWAS